MASARSDSEGGDGAWWTAPLSPFLGVSDDATRSGTAVSISTSTSDSELQLSPSSATPGSAVAASLSSSSCVSPLQPVVVLGDAMAFAGNAVQTDLFGESDAFVMPDLAFLDALNVGEYDALLPASQSADDGGDADVHGAVRIGENAHASFTCGGTRGVPVMRSAVLRDPHAGPEKQAAGKLKRIRKCVKRELDYLRAQVHNFEEQLAVLQRTRAATATDSVDPTTATMTPVGQSGGLWERIAHNQMREKQQSEKENAKLRELLESQIKVANALTRALKKSPDVSWLESLGIGPLHKRSRIHDATNSIAEDIYETLSRRVNSLYAQLDTVFANWAADTRAETPDIQVKSDANGSTFLEFFSSKVFPFHLATTSAAAWKLTGLSLAKLPNGHYEATEATNDVVRSHASGTLRIQQTEVGIHSNIIIKKLEQEDRVVILWSILGRSEVSNTPIPKFTIRENGWLIIRDLHQDLEGAQVSESPRSSIMQSVVHVRPEFIAKTGGETSYRGDFPPGVLTDVIMCSYLQTINTTYQRIENILVVDAAIGNEASV